MRQAYKLLGLLGVGVFVLAGVAGCKSKPKIDYSPLEQSGMYATAADELKTMNISTGEIGQVAKMKQAGASDDLCLALVKSSRGHGHEFTSGDSAVHLSAAGYSDAQILQMAQSDQIDILSGEAVTLKLIGLSGPMVQKVMDRRMQGLPTLTSEQIARLKNTGMTEKQITEAIDKGMSDAQAETFITQHEANRDHANTGFVRTRGRRR
jgi:hypothetical protein